VAPHSTAEQIRSYGVQAHPSRFDLDEFFRLPASRALIQSGNVVRQMRALTTAMSAGLMAATT